MTDMAQDPSDWQGGQSRAERVAMRARRRPVLVDV